LNGFGIKQTVLTEKILWNKKLTIMYCGKKICVLSF